MKLELSWRRMRRRWSTRRRRGWSPRCFSFEFVFVFAFVFVYTRRRKCWSPRCFTYMPLYLYLYLCLSVSPRCLTFVVALALLCTNCFHNISCYNIYNISCYNINIPCYAVCSLPKAWLKALDKHFRCWSYRAPWRSWAAELTVWRRRTWGWEVKTKF